MTGKPASLSPTSPVVRRPQLAINGRYIPFSICSFFSLIPTSSGVYVTVCKSLSKSTTGADGGWEGNKFLTPTPPLTGKFESQLTNYQGFDHLKDINAIKR